MQPFLQLNQDKLREVEQKLDQGESDLEARRIITQEKMDSATFKQSTAVRNKQASYELIVEKISAVDQGQIGNIESIMAVSDFLFMLVVSFLIYNTVMSQYD